MADELSEQISEETGLQLTYQQSSQDGLASLVRVVESLAPVVKDYVETLTRANDKEQETEQMSLQLDYQLRSKALDLKHEERKYDHEEQKDARIERREIRRWALWGLFVMGAVMVAAIFKGKESAALELVKMLVTFLSLAAGAYLYGERRAEQRKEKRKSAPAENDDDQDKESD